MMMHKAFLKKPSRSIQAWLSAHIPPPPPPPPEAAAAVLLADGRLVQVQSSSGTVGKEELAAAGLWDAAEEEWTEEITSLSSWAAVGDEAFRECSSLSSADLAGSSVGSFAF